MSVDPTPLDHGLRVFGSALVRVAPDRAMARLVVSRREPEPAAAFASARTGAASVASALTDHGLTDVRSSRITMSQDIRPRDRRDEPPGYVASITFEVGIDVLDDLETVVVAAVDAGANVIREIAFTTTRLQVIREEARAAAVRAARRKAEVYAEAAGVTLGRVRAIVDANPDRLAGREGHMASTRPPDAVTGAIDPGSIAVGGAVWITFDLV
ncbi:MAG: SIMPL domain-containing protein [Myxococcota bacterium]